MVLNIAIPFMFFVWNLNEKEPDLKITATESSLEVM